MLPPQVKNANTTADLVKHCERAGARIRKTSKNATMVADPSGRTTLIPHKWAHARMRQNTIASLAHLDLKWEQPARTFTLTEPKEPPMTTTAQFATQATVDALFEELVSLTDRVNELEAEIVALKAGRPGRPPMLFEQAQVAVLEFFQKLPAGVWLGPAVVSHNLQVDSGQRDTYRRALFGLAAEGKLDKRGDESKKGTLIEFSRLEG